MAVMCLALITLSQVGWALGGQWWRMGWVDVPCRVEESTCGTHVSGRMGHSDSAAPVGMKMASALRRRRWGWGRRHGRRHCRWIGRLSST